MRIDAHQHFWKINRGDYDWLNPELQVLYRDFLPEDLVPHLMEHRIDGTILVQAAPTIAETEYLLSLYKRNPFIAGVVGWLDLESEIFIDEYRRLREEEGFIGIRPMLQDLEDDQWILRPKVLKSIEQLASDDFPIDILVVPRHLPYIEKLMEYFPNLRAVIDHIAKPDISSGMTEAWMESIAKLARYQNVMCKMSGMITEMKQPLKRTELKPFINHILKCFGTEAVMFGSDWPVCLLAGSYRDVYQTLLAQLPPSLTTCEFTNIFGENAIKFYKLTPRSDSC
jgi:L-fuconolactonase